ncbi:Carboxylesterase type B [Macrophomina phaseolina MS6]|uniref:Carboxylesterase type B n=2 Tax=Macrophomina phaseolina TaxID=35725 RepID=K2RY94_MACPH|nr:Carboxylesterase type B [Macrophomina phaseolina MS6]
MIGDVRDEAMIFRGALDDQDYGSVREKFVRFMGEESVEIVLRLYGIHPEVTHAELEQRFEEMASDGIFKVQTYLHAHASKVPQTYAYHVDQVSTLENPLKGLAYHAIDLLYVFMNLEEQMSEGQRKLARKMAGDFIDFAYGKEPWERFGGGNWMVYGPDDRWSVKTEKEDEAERQYGRMRKILDMSVFPQWAEALDYIVNKRWILGAA